MQPLLLHLVTFRHKWWWAEHWVINVLRDVCAVLFNYVTAYAVIPVRKHAAMVKSLLVRIAGGVTVRLCYIGTRLALQEHGECIRFIIRHLEVRHTLRNTLGSVHARV